MRQCSAAPRCAFLNLVQIHTAAGARGPGHPARRVERQPDGARLDDEQHDQRAGSRLLRRFFSPANSSRQALARLRQGRRLGAIDLASLLFAERQSFDADRAELDARATAVRAIFKLRIDAHLIWAKPEE